MRYLNKIVFINSAAIRYSEVQLDGNIHLIGTQGVGKSTILRAILFFYNADTQRLGIPVEKKSYQDYYFPYADSSIIYEVAREDGWFTVLSYKTMNRICYRFIASPYRPDLFIDEEGAPYPSDRIRSVLDKNGIKYSGAISTYEEYRNILYGNSDNKRDYSCYSLMESGSYQNIIRTIQNVLLNSRLEADYIKQTIITSLNEADSVIDLSRYRSHLSGFEAQLNDIGVFREPGMVRKAAGISTLSDDIRKRDLRINDLCRQLRGAYMQTERILPELSRKIHEQEAVKGRLGNYDANRKDLELKIRELKYELNYQTKEFETAEKHLDEDYQKLAESNEVKIEALSAKLAELTEFLDNQKDSFFNWLSEHKPGWEQTIGQVCDERLLYGKEFTAEVGEGDTFYGIRFTSGIHRNVKTKEDYLTEKKEAEEKRAGIQRFIATARQDLEAAKENLRKQYQSSVKPIKEDIYHAEYELEQLAVRKKEDESRLSALRDQATRLRQEEIRRLEEELNAAEAALSSIRQEIATLQGKMDRELASLDEQEKDELAALDKELSARREAISEEIARKKAELEERKSGYDREQLDSLTASGGDPRRLEEIHSRLAYIGGEIKYINETKALIIEYLKDKREMLDKVPDWTAESLRLQQIIHGEQEELKKRLADVNRNIFKIDAELKELKEANRKALENREEYHRSTLLDWFTSRESIFSSMNRTDTDGDCRSLVREITIRVSEQSQKLSELRKEITAYTGNFSEDNVFAFKTSFSDDKEYMDFACDLKEFIDEDKVSEYQSRINTRNSDIFRQITADTKSMVSQEGNIRGVVDQINADFKEKNFVGIIQCIEMRIDPSQNKIVNLLKEIKRFNEEYSWDLGQNLFASSADDTATREKATTLLRELIKSMDAYSGNLIRLADFFDLKFRVIENRNDTGFVERLTNVGSEGTDILVKSMVNIMLLNVFKRNASTVFSDFRLHCMMDEIGKLHPNNVAGILKFANDRDILLINGSPTEQDALSYKHIYKLEKDTDSFTRIRRVITQFD